MLDELDEQGGDPVLRFWESDRHFVVLGPSCRLDRRRPCRRVRTEWSPPCSGAPAAEGPFCKDQAVSRMHSCCRSRCILTLANIRSTNQFILDRMAAALHRWEPGTVFQGISDLAIGGRKISGNAQRRKRNALLFHGTILYAMQGDLVGRYLKHPARQPEYREDRPHGAFLRTIDVPPQDLKVAIAEAWDADTPLAVWPEARMADCIRNVLHRSEIIQGAEVPFGLAAH